MDVKAWLLCFSYGLLIPYAAFAYKRNLKKKVQNNSWACWKKNSDS
jgi:hypothetical protein